MSVLGLTCPFGKLITTSKVKERHLCMTTAAEINIKCTVESNNESGKELKTMTFPLKFMWDSTDFF